MLAVCPECSQSDDHELFSGTKPDFASHFIYATCRSCGAVFNTVNAVSKEGEDIEYVCEGVLAKVDTRLGCYIFGPASSGVDDAFGFEHRKRLQLRDSLPKRPVVSSLLEWVRFPEEDMPKSGTAPTGPLGQQEIRLVKRRQKEGLYPMLIFIVASPGAIAELKIASQFPNNSLVFIKANLASSLVGQDEVVAARGKGAEVFFYSADAGCSLRAFAIDFLIEKIAQIWGYLEAEEEAREELTRLGIKKRRRNKRGKA